MEEKHARSAKDNYRANRKGLKFLASWAGSYLHPKVEEAEEDQISVELSDTHNAEGKAISYTGRNRREFYRQRLDHEVTLARLDEEGNTELHVSGKLLDISANGVRFTMEDEGWSVGDCILVDWSKDVPWPRSFKFKAEIRRVDDSMSGLFYGCTIVDMPERDQDDLVQMIFKLQQDERARRGRR